MIIRRMFSERVGVREDIERAFEALAEHQSMMGGCSETEVKVVIMYREPCPGVTRAATSKSDSSEPPSARSDKLSRVEIREVFQDRSNAGCYVLV